MPVAKEISRLLEEAVERLGLESSPQQLQQLATHFTLLLRWNEKINLTSVRKADEIVERHFGESLFLITLLKPPATGFLIDVGSGAGFPGLPLKVAWPSVETVLLEPNQKKAAFLKEVVRSCQLKGVAVRSERLEEAVVSGLAGRGALVTMRAVKPSREVLAEMSRLLTPGGRIALFLGEEAAAQVRGSGSFDWAAPVPLPGSERRVILLGRR